MACRYLNRFLLNRQTVLYHKTVESLYPSQAFSNSLFVRHTSAQINAVGSRFPPAQIKALLKTKSLNNNFISSSISAVCFSTSTKNYIGNDPLKEKVLLSQQKLSFEPKIKKPDSFIAPYLQLARVDKPIGTMLLLWPCVWSIGMASFHLTSSPLDTLYTLSLFSTGAFIMRGAGCTINDLWDIKFDKKVERTRLRPLAAGTLTTKQAVGFLAIQLSGGLAILTQLNNYSIVLGAASLSLVFIYPFMKRITYWPQVVLGLAFNWGALLGWSAMTGSLDWKVTLPLYLAGVNWTLIYDTIYAHQDKKDDIKIGVKSTALFMASDTRKYLTGFSLATIGLLCTSGFFNGQGLPFYLATLLGGGTHLAWQLNTVDYNCSKSCWDKFKSNQQFGALVAFGIYADYIITCL